MPIALKIALYYVFPIVQDALFVLLILRGVTLYKQRKNGDSRQVSLCPLLLLVGSVCGGLFCILVTVFGLIGPPSIILWLVFEAPALLGYALLLGYCNETVVYDGEAFTAKNWLGIRRTYSYAEISGIRRRGADTILYCGRRRVRLDQMALNAQPFVKHAETCYFQQFQQLIPIIIKKDPMRGNLDTPWFYFFMFLFVIAVSLFFFFFSVYGLLPAEASLPSDAFEIRASFVSWERIKKNGGTLVLNAADFEKPFKLSWLSGFEVPVPDPEFLCGGTEFAVIVEEEKTEYWIRAISTADQRLLLSAYDYSTAYRNTQFWPCIGLIVFSVFEICFAMFGILVGRNPDRFPEWLRKLFYQPWVWTSSSYQNGKSRKKKHR